MGDVVGSGPVRYRTKPVVIEAWRWDGSPELAAALVKWAEGFAAAERAPAQVEASWHRGEWRLLVHTLEGTMVASPGDYVVRRLGGEFYFCKPALFEAKYEPESSPPDALT